MLKPADPPTGSERHIGDIVGQLVEDGKAYANAEIDVAKAIVAEKGKALVPPAILLGTAIILALAGITALAVGVVIALAKFVGPLLAGLAGLLIFGGLAGLLGWMGVNKLKAIL
jgi:uncharacterized membrane protein YqjE